MSRARHFPSWTAAPEEFRTTLKLLLSANYGAPLAFDRSWTFRFPTSDRRDLMVEITHLSPSGSQSAPPFLVGDADSGTTTTEFESDLRDLLTRAQDGGISLDRSWRFQYPDADRYDLMVEVSYLK